ncbi:MAG: hypothetical protein QM733_04400 [Ilumatobacteraceae bacterium]
MTAREPNDDVTPNPTRPAALDCDGRLITLAVTLRWREPWALDACEAGALPKAVQRALVVAARDGALADWVELIEAIESVRSWDPAEEIELGRHLPAVALPAPSTE